MFLSKQRPILFPQSEHQRLAGAIAMLWGNGTFDHPPVPPESLVLGIGMHDRAYGALDNLPIGGVPEGDWLALTRRGFGMQWADAQADLIAKLHLQRLVGNGGSPVRQVLAAEMAQAIPEYCRRHHLDTATFARIDRITDLCDSIAFDWCFEAPARGTVAIFPRNDSADQVVVQYQIAEGIIRLDPWPLRVDRATGYLIGYQQAGYPEQLEPLIVPYELCPGHV